MSSHHVIREDQEPALILANGAECSDSLLFELLEWSPHVMVLDGALDRVIEKKIKFDTLLGDFDSVQNIEQKVADYQPVQIVPAMDQDKTDLHKGIRYLLDKGHSGIHIVWATGKRADHAMSNMLSLAHFWPNTNIVMYDDHSRIYCLPRKFSKFYPAGTPISLIPVGETGGIHTSGLKYELRDGALDIRSKLGSSNVTVADGVVEVTYEHGILLMMECWD